ncbi:hypothetical protein P154DRAFT_538206 [Amniculicola lignicola CBS 123094]|uniref:Uncharacterized protein n=1 Tax=Amniculicola lignicola CBS 123094 TaxID=1392246 RepID=A0A6A5W2U5_9PLEO|nr:hypothetical protein P154DRAFT_538206 [Amniculicola lignicola CBS 123094]
MKALAGVEHHIPRRTAPKIPQPTILLLIPITKRRETGGWIALLLTQVIPQDPHRINIVLDQGLIVFTKVIGAPIRVDGVGAFIGDGSRGALVSGVGIQADDAEWASFLAAVAADVDWEVVVVLDVAFDGRTVLMTAINVVDGALLMVGTGPAKIFLGVERALEMSWLGLAGAAKARPAKTPAKIVLMVTDRGLEDMGIEEVEIAGDLGSFTKDSL